MKTTYTDEVGATGIDSPDDEDLILGKVMTLLS
jgi:hypothetical protein